MTKSILLGWLFSLTVFIAYSVGLQSATAQTRQRYTALQQALAATGQLSGSAGPRSVNWIEGGNKFSYTDGTQIIKTVSPKDR
jgi:dipeptidyl-peptidase-4